MAVQLEAGSAFRFRPAPGAQALCAWSDADLQAIADLATGPWRAWLAGWSTAADPAESTAVATRAHESDAPSRQWQSLGTRDGGAAWLADGEEQAQRLVHWLLFGELPAGAPASGGAMAGRLRAEACGDLLAMLRRELGVALDGAPGAAPPGPGSHLWHRWSGAVELVLGCEDAELHILMDAACVQAIRGYPEQAKPMARSGDLVAIPHALASQRIGLRAILEPVELNLGSLAQLQPGDIVPLSHPLDADVVLADDEGTRLLAGFLGRAGSRRALQLTPGAGASRPIAP